MYFLFMYERGKKEAPSSDKYIYNIDTTNVIKIYLLT